MALSFQKNQTGSGTQSAHSEINVTPLVDVMLVLLIVFMVSAPLMQQGISVDLPKTNAPSMNEAPEQMVLVIERNKRILLNGNLVSSSDLREKLIAIAKMKPNLEIVIQGDQGVPYGTVAQVMAEVKQAGINRVGLATEPAPQK